jgi:hypothetical protein
MFYLTSSVDRGDPLGPLTVQSFLPFRCLFLIHSSWAEVVYPSIHLNVLRYDVYEKKFFFWDFCEKSFFAKNVYLKISKNRWENDDLNNGYAADKQTNSQFRD